MSSFEDRVFDAVKKIPCGYVSTYGAVAASAGSPRAARAVGNILHKNPMPYIVPCHRVVHGDGRLAAAYAFGGEDVQRSLLEDEGVIFKENGKVDMNLCGYTMMF